MRVPLANGSGESKSMVDLFWDVFDTSVIEDNLQQIRGLEKMTTDVWFDFFSLFKFVSLGYSSYNVSVT
jgi:hypothetical protein